MHQFNFEDVEKLTELVSSFSQQPYKAPLGGVVVTGVGTSLEVKRYLLKTLQKGGSLFTEMLYTNSSEELIYPGDQEQMNKLKLEFDLTDFGLSSLPTTHIPHQILIRPKD